MKARAQGNRAYSKWQVQDRDRGSLAPESAPNHSAFASEVLWRVLSSWSRLWQSTASLNSLCYCLLSFHGESRVKDLRVSLPTGLSSPAVHLALHCQISLPDGPAVITEHPVRGL